MGLTERMIGIMSFCKNCGSEFTNGIICRVCSSTYSNNRVVDKKKFSEQDTTPLKNIIKLYSKKNKMVEKFQPVGTYARLIVEKGGTTGREFPVNREISVIGRWDPNINSHPEIDLSDEDLDANVSRQHGKIIFEDNNFFIIDTDSRNGIYLNREIKLNKNEKYILKDGDELIIGQIFFRFEIS